MGKKAQLYEALSKIAEVAREAVGGWDGGEQSGYEDEVDQESEQAPDYGCTIKSLPRRLLAKAAETAIKINPVNGLTMGPLAQAAPDLPTDPARLALLVSKYWGPTPRRLTVSFMENTSNALRTRIISHMNAWTRTGCIEFVATQGTGQVRISRGRGGFFSYLGTDILRIPQNRQTMNLQGFTMSTRESEYLRVVRHEAGHTLGFPHEHMRRQLVARLHRERTYAYFLREYGWGRSTVDEQVLTPLEERSIRGTPTDQDSIMCYPLPAEVTRDGQPIRGGNDINELDYRFCGIIYPKASAGQMRDQGDEGDDWPESEDEDIDDVSD